LSEISGSERYVTEKASSRIVVTYDVVSHHVDGGSLLQSEVEKLNGLERNFYG
jgi:hypothetical protein